MSAHDEFQSVIFANDFAGRIASNIVQAAASLRESVVQIIDALWFVTVFAVSALCFAGTDWRLACPLALWITGYIATLAYFVPRIRRRSEELAHMRATVMGRIVDSYTNIQTVKLFAHLGTCPILSKMPIEVHITQPDIRATRSASPVAIAMSPRVTAPRIQSQTASAPTLTRRTLLLDDTVRFRSVISRVWR